MNFVTRYVAPVFIGFTAFFMSLAMSGVTGVDVAFAFYFGLASGVIIAVGGVWWMAWFHKKYTRP